MTRKIFCVSIVVYLVSSAMAFPSNAWAASGWTTEPNRGSGWDKTEAKFPEAWKSTAGDDSQGKGWVSSEGMNDSKAKAVPTSWQKVDRHHGSSVKSSGWSNADQKSAINPQSQDIANGFIVHHPIPSSNHWNQQALPLEPWNKQSTEEFWPEDANKKSASSSSVGWEKTAAESQWSQNQAPATSSSWDSKSAWEKTDDVSTTSAWNKNSSPSAWESDALNARESAAGYAATGPAQYSQESSLNAWQDKGANTNGWEKNAEAWKKDSAPSALYDAPAKWDSKPASDTSGWEKAPSGSDFKMWQKETSGWKDSGVGAWQQATPDVATQKPWQKNTSSSGWQKDTSEASSGWKK